MDQSPEQIEAIRNSTASRYVIFWDGHELDTMKEGAVNSAAGIVLTAKIPELDRIVEHRSNDNYGRKGFSFRDDGKALPSAIRNRLVYKY